MSVSTRKRCPQRHCFVPGCQTGYKRGKNQPKISIFSAPLNIQERKRWEMRIRRADKPFNEKCSVCEIHFCEDFIQRNFRHVVNGEVVLIPRARPILLPGAVPSIFPNRPKHLTTSVKKRPPIKIRPFLLPKKIKTSPSQEDTQSTPPTDTYFIPSEFQKAKFPEFWKRLCLKNSPHYKLSDNWNDSTVNPVILQEHFEDSQFEKNRADNWKKLKQTAIPTLFHISDTPSIKGTKRIKGNKQPKSESLLEAQVIDKSQGISESESVRSQLDDDSTETSQNTSDKRDSSMSRNPNKTQDTTLMEGSSKVNIKTEVDVENDTAVGASEAVTTLSIQDTNAHDMTHVRIEDVKSVERNTVVNTAPVRIAGTTFLLIPSTVASGGIPCTFPAVIQNNTTVGSIPAVIQNNTTVGSIPAGRISKVPPLVVSSTRTERLKGSAPVKGNDHPKTSQTLSETSKATSTVIGEPQVVFIKTEPVDDPEENMEPVQFIMPRRCSVAGCRSNYDGEAQNTTTFSLPSDPTKRKIWCKMIPNDLSGLKHPIVCIKHFDESCIIRKDKLMYRGELKEYDRVVPKLTNDAVPSIFTKCPRRVTKSDLITETYAKSRTPESSDGSSVPPSAKKQKKNTENVGALAANVQNSLIDRLDTLNRNLETNTCAMSILSKAITDSSEANVRAINHLAKAIIDIGGLIYSSLEKRNSQKAE